MYKCVNKAILYFHDINPLLNCPHHRTIPAVVMKGNITENISLKYFVQAGELDCNTRERRPSQIRFISSIPRMVMEFPIGDRNLRLNADWN